MRVRPLVAAIPAAVLSLAVGAAPGHATPTTSSYVVVLRDGASATPAAAAAFAASLGGTVTHVYQHALHGYSANLTPTAVELVRHSSDVAYVERDGVMHAVGTIVNPQSWGIDRIDQRNLPLSASYTSTNTGSGVKAYIIDTGIRFTHTQFGGRAVTGIDEVTAGGTAADCNGHGTHVAGTVGGSTIGVAHSVTLVAVRVLDCTGSGATSGVIAGVDWVTGNHLAGQPAVANMSLGGGAYAPLDTAVTNAINDGVTFAVASGNGNASGVRQNACNYSPARVAAAITTGATSNTDAAASFSNYGTCVDLLAPGVQILSSWYTSDTAGAYLDGTSMATPHVAGVAALYLQSNPGASPATVRNALVANATSGVITNVGTGTPNLLLFTNY